MHTIFISSLREPIITLPIYNTSLLPNQHNHATKHSRLDSIWHHFCETSKWAHQFRTDRKLSVLTHPVMVRVEQRVQLRQFNETARPPKYTAAEWIQYLLKAGQKTEPLYGASVTSSNTWSSLMTALTWRQYLIFSKTVPCVFYTSTRVTNPTSYPGKKKA